MSNFKKILTGWGNYPHATCFVDRPERYQQLALDNAPLIARGLGRSYGDASLNSAQRVILMERLNRFLSFDENKGILQAEAGVSLADILQVFVPRGWFLPVTPGTKFATLGGCLACDVHGKNHHVDGSFSKYVSKLDLLLADGSTRRCSPTQDADLFWATVGGMGLTGVITQIALQLIPIQTAYMRVKHYPAQNLDDVLRILSDPTHDDRYSVAWIDAMSTGKALGRGVVMQGHHATPQEMASKDPLKVTVKPPRALGSFFPSWLLNRWTLKSFNHCYYSAQTRQKQAFNVSYDAFFYPLDGCADWNNLYGKKGFIQYQCVVPYKNGDTALHAIFNACAKSSRESYLAVLKRFGAQGPGHLSFPCEGYTLAMDIPIKDDGLFPFLNQLDEIVLSYGGRIYLAKDARLQPESLRQMYPRLAEWQAIKSKVDPKGLFSSDLSRRLKLEGV